MGNLKHTKGEWIIAPNELVILKSGTLDVISDCDTTDVKTSIDTTEMKANAKLIAAAPDLLEACLMYRNIIQEEGCIPDIEQIELTKLVYKAIKKATDGNNTKD